MSDRRNTHVPLRRRWPRPGAIWIASLLATAAPVARAEEPPEPPLNVVLISLDTVRPDHLSCYGYARMTTPNIDRLARDGVIFTQAFSQAANTFPSHLSIFTSRYPKKSWLTWQSADLEPATETLTEVLSRHGYRTARFTDFAMQSMLEPIRQSRAFVAFDIRHESTRFTELPDQLFGWLGQRHDRPFFLFLQGFDAHNPHLLPAPYDAKRFNPDYRGPVPSTTAEMDTLIAAIRSGHGDGQPSGGAPMSLQQKMYQQLFPEGREVSAEDLHHLHALYDAQLYYLDQGLARLFQALENLDLMRHTLVVLFSDHGQAFGERGQYVSHERCYVENTRMVMIVRDPRSTRRGERLTQVVQGIDLMPTILDLLDLPVPGSVQGRSLAPLLRTGRDPDREELAVSLGTITHAIRMPQWTLIQVREGGAELYETALDPGERRNVIAQHPAVAAQLAQRLAAITPDRIWVDDDADTAWRQNRTYW